MHLQCISESTDIWPVPLIYKKHRGTALKMADSENVGLFTIQCIQLGIISQRESVHYNNEHFCSMRPCLSCCASLYMHA